MSTVSFPNTDVNKILDKDGDLIIAPIDKFTKEKRIIDQNLNDGILELNKKMDTVIDLLKQILE